MCSEGKVAYPRKGVWAGRWRRIWAAVGPSFGADPTATPAPQQRRTDPHADAAGELPVSARACAAPPAPSPRVRRPRHKRRRTAQRPPAAEKIRTAKKPNTTLPRCVIRRWGGAKFTRAGAGSGRKTWTTLHPRRPFLDRLLSWESIFSTLGRPREFLTFEQPISVRLVKLVGRGL